MSTPADRTEAAAAERFRRADAVFGEALDLPVEARRSFVAEACGGDAELLREVASLLQAHDESEEFLLTPAAAIARGSEEAASSAGLHAPPPSIAQYQMIRPLGRGGMGIVWLARDDRLGRDVAVKFLAGPAVGTSEDEAARERFLVEARAAARLDHPNVASVYEAGEAPDGRLYMVMTYCPGGSLADLIATGPVHPTEAVKIAQQLATALAAAHAAGIVHRDVKPANVLLDAGGQVRLADFGIAKLMDAGITQSNAARGTVAYLAPEQLRGERVDVRADLWGLGVTLYEIISGRRAFGGSSYGAVLHSIVAAEPEPLGTLAPVSPELESLVGRLLSKNPDDRPQTAEEVEQRLATLSEADAATGKQRTGDRRRRHSPRLRIGVAAAAAVAVVLAGGAYLAAGRSSADLPPPATASGPSVAVLPFRLDGADSSDAPLADGLTDGLIDALGHLPGLRVLSRTSASALGQSGGGAPVAAASLGIAHLVEGTVRRLDGRLRANVQLTAAADGRVVWSETYDRPMGDIFEVQEEIARAVAAALEVAPSAAAGAAGYGSGTSDLEAYELYLKGRYFRTRRTEASLAQAARYFESAIARDSSFARAYAGLSSTYTFLALFGHQAPHEVMPQARTFAERGVGYDANLAEAHAALAHVLWVYDLEWQRADDEFARAVALDPGYATGHLLRGIALLDQLRFAEAEASLQAARRLDPLDPSVSLSLGRMALSRGHADEAAAMLESAVELNPEFSYAHQQLGYAYLAQGRSAAALAAFRRAAELAGARDSAHLAYGLAATGSKGAAEAILSDLAASAGARYLPPFGMAAGYAGTGNRDSAFAWLDRSLEDRSPFVSGARTLPAFASLRDDTRWRRLLERMNLTR